MKALQTEYRGIKYRSRTEARWAVFLDELQVPYTYEPEGYDLGGEWYLPDFWLPNPGCYLEIKGVAPNDRERRMAVNLVKAARCPVFIAVGPPPIDDTFNMIGFGVGGNTYDCAFTGDKNDLFVSSECQGVMRTIRGSHLNISGAPRPVTGPARVAANMRFGVHE